MSCCQGDDDGSGCTCSIVKSTTLYPRPNHVTEYPSRASWALHSAEGSHRRIVTDQGHTVAWGTLILLSISLVTIWLG